METQICLLLLNADHCCCLVWCCSHVGPGQQAGQVEFVAQCRQVGCALKHIMIHMSFFERVQLRPVMLSCGLGEVEVGCYCSPVTANQQEGSTTDQYYTPDRTPVHQTWYAASLPVRILRKAIILWLQHYHRSWSTTPLFIEHNARQGLTRARGH